MSGGGWGMNPSPLFASGGQISGLGGDADAAGRGLLTAISEAEGTVHHAVVTAALGRYHSTVSKPANQLGEDVRALGSQVQTTATTGAQADADATTDLTPAATSTSESGSSLTRPVNVGGGTSPTGTGAMPGPSRLAGAGAIPTGGVPAGW